MPESNGQADHPEAPATTTQVVINTVPAPAKPVNRTPAEKPTDYSHLGLNGKTCASFINDIFDKPELADYKVGVTRIAPSYMENIEIPPRGPIEDILTCLRESVGPGTYRVRVYDGNGWHVQGSRGTITVKIGQNEGQYAGPNIPFPRDAQGGIRQDDDEATRLRKERVVIDETIQTETKREQLKRLKETAEREAEMKLSQPVESLKEELRAQRETFKEELRAMRDELKSSQNKLDLPALLTALAPVLTVVLAKPVAEKGGDIKDFVAMMAEMNKQSAQSSTAMMTQLQGMVIELIGKKADNPETMFKTMMDMRREGREEAKEMFEMMNKNDDDFDVDPNNVWGSIAAGGIKALINAFKHGGPQIMQMIASRVGKPATQVTEADLGELQRKIEQLPPPPQQAALPAPTSQAPVMFNPAPANESITGPAQVQPPIISSPNGTAQQPVMEPTPEASPLPPVPEGLDAVETDLRHSINEVIQDFLLMDIKAERPEHDWPFMAVKSWHRSFLKELADAPSGFDRMKLIRIKANPALMKQVDDALAAVHVSNYSRLDAALNVLADEIKKVLGETAAAPQT